MKNKILLLSILAIIIFPTVTFASWWNPFSWFNNWNFSQETKTEILEQRIQELEDKLKTSNAPTTTPIVVNGTPNKTSVVSNPTPIQNKKDVTLQKINEQPVMDVATCDAISAEEKALNATLDKVIGYFQKDIMPIYSSKTDGDIPFSTQHDKLTSARSDFFREIETFKSREVTKIQSQYLANEDVKLITDNLISLANGYKDMWDTVTTNLIILQTVNPRDSYDKYKGIDLLTQDYNLEKANLALLQKSLDMWKELPSKYLEVKNKYNCNLSKVTPIITN